MQKQKGFTIIELIVAIAIIAVLATIVLVNINGYMNKSKDTAAMGDLDSLVKMGNIWFADNNDYSSFGASAPAQRVQNFLINNGYMSSGYALIFGQSSVWCQSITLKAQATTYCVDYTGLKAQGKQCSTTGPTTGACQ